jgi:hypothetical protein
MPAQAVKDAIDNSTYLGGGVSTGGILIYVTEWAPIVGITISSIAGILTAIHLYKRIKISNQEIELNNQKLKRRHDDELD